MAGRVLFGERTRPNVKQNKSKVISRSLSTSYGGAAAPPL